MAGSDGLDFMVFGRHARDDRYYGQLAERFEKADTTLFGSDFLVLYYGYAYRDEYDGGYGRDPWNEATKEKRYAEAYDALNSALKKAPAPRAVGRFVDRPGTRTARRRGATARMEALCPADMDKPARGRERTVSGGRGQRP